ncbi:MAG TPA: cupredoxin domain-containing protein [Armatimonadota bacterium]|jgi:plastocyanin
MRAKWLLVLIAAVVLSVVGTLRYATTRAATGSTSASVALADALDEEFLARVEIKGLDFRPHDLRVPLGTTVIWINHDHAKHTVTSKEFDSGNLGYHHEFRYTFLEPGRYEYHCRDHGWMKGAIIVE